MAHALLAVSRPSKRLAAPSVSSNNDASDDAFSTLASNNNNSLRHQYSIASTSSTLYTCSEEDEHSIPEEEEAPVIDSAACDEVIQDSRLNGAGLPIPWYSHNIEASTSSTSSSNKSKERAANHAMRFKRKNGSSRASLETLGQDWHPRTASSSMDAALAHSPSKGSSHSSSSSPRKLSQSSCTCHVDEVSSSLTRDALEEEGEESLSIDDQLDKMIRMTSELLRVSKGVLASSKRVSVTKASESQILHSHEHALRQHLESLETQDRFMHYISNEAHSILTSVEQAQSPLSPLHSSLPHSYIKSPPVSRARLRPHSSQGSMSAPAIRATTMYINAEMGNGKDPANVNVDRERHASSASYVTGGSSLGSVREEEGDSLAEGAQDVQETSTPAHISKNVARKVSHLSELSIATSNGMLQQATATSNLSAPDVSATMLSPTLSSATANSSTPSSTFFSSFWSRSSAATNASSNLSSHSSPNTTMDTSSPSLSRFLARKSAPPAHNTNTEEDKKDAKGMLSALAASSPPMPSSEPDASSSKPRLEASSSSFIPPTSPTTTTSSITASSSLSQHQGYEARSPPMPSSASTAALAQLSAIHSSPHLTVSSRPRHRASLSESLLRASWSGNNLKSEVAAAVAKGAKEESAKGHKRSRHSTSPAGQFQAQVSNVSVNHKRERSGRDRE